MTPEGKAAMLRFAQYAAEHWGAQLEELIHTPLGFGIKNGVRVPPYATADHYNHVHIADTDPPAPGDKDAGPPKNGGAVPAGPSAGGGLGVGGGGGFFGLGLHVHLVRWDGSGGRAPDIPGIPPGVPDSIRQVLYSIMMCESGGNPTIEGRGNAAGHFGLFQFDLPTWASVGGHGNPADAPPEEQWMRAVMLYQRRGFQPWECAANMGYV
jgi:Transglycosylase-like domain